MRALLACLLLAVAGTAHGSTWVAWSPSLPRDNPDNLAAPFEFRRTAVMGPDRRAGLRELDDAPATRTGAAGALIIHQREDETTYRQPAGSDKPAISVLHKYLRVVEFNAPFDAAAKLKEANPRLELVCIRLELRAKKNCPGDTHLMLICTDNQALQTYLADVGIKIREGTARSGVTWDHAFDRFSEPFNSPSQFDGCRDVLYAACSGPDYVGRRRATNIPDNMADAPAGGYKVGTCTKMLACGSEFARDQEARIVGYGTKIHGNTALGMVVRKNDRGQVTGVAVAFPGTKSGTEAWGDVNFLATAFLDRWKVLHLGKGLPDTLWAAYGILKSLSENNRLFLRFIGAFVENELLPQLKDARGALRPDVPVLLVGISLGGFLSQFVGLHLLALGHRNVNVASGSGPGAVRAYAELAGTVFGRAVPAPRWPADPMRFVNLHQWQDWIPRLGRQPGFTCFSNGPSVEVNDDGETALDKCGKWSNLQVTGVLQLANGACMAKVHNSPTPAAETACCQAGASWCGLYVPAEGDPEEAARRAEMERLREEQLARERAEAAAFRKKMQEQNRLERENRNRKKKLAGGRVRRDEIFGGRMRAK